ncbi:glycerophosphodiester phosphodiesterase family protein [Chitinophaga deserti]|uniref:glycerophosphodiester phosphodiesterase family protein n=1 Tax=Chitinophaga deserti TaxID=2164099 RepID=UPI000D6D973A|nr:glycerophosphodiester phosphodiesterase family protein [Chitinophaga deserti]
MKLIFSTLLLATVTFAANAQTSRADSILYRMHKQPDHILVAAHRAAHEHYPENSIASIREAIRLGTDIAELDVQRTKDGVFVLMHDRTITRTTGKPGSVADYTLAQLRRFPLLHNGQPTNERIPTFREALKAAKGKILVDVDFKADGVAAAKYACVEIRKSGMTKYVLFFLYDHEEAPALMAFDKDIPVMPRVRDAAATQQTLKYGKFPALHLDETFYNDRLADSVRATGARVWMNTLGEFDKEEKVQADSGFDHFFRSFPRTGIVQTDLPGQLLNYLRRKGMRP